MVFVSISLYMCLHECVFRQSWEPITAQSQSLIDFPANSNEALLCGTIEQSSLCSELFVAV